MSDRTAYRRAIVALDRSRLRKVEITKFEILNRQAIFDLSEALAAAGVSKTELARRMGREVSTVAEWFIGGRKNLPIAILYALTAPELEVFLENIRMSAGLTPYSEETG